MDEQQWRNEATLDAPDAPAAVTTVPVAASKPKKRIPWLWVWIGIGLLILATAILIILWLRQTINKTQANNQANQVKVQTIDLGAITGNSTSIDLSKADKVIINGELQSNEGIILTPTAQPSVATFGQIYVDQTTKQVRYYNGTEFVTLATDNGNFATQTQLAALLAATAGTTTAVESLQGQSGTLSLVGSGGLTIGGSGGSISLNLPQNLTVTSNPTFAGMTLSGLSGSSVVITNASSTLQSVTAVAPGLCLVSTAGLPTFDSCVAGGASVASLDGLTGALILANSSGSGTTVTIDNASTSAKGIAQFNATNFSASSGVVNTIQDIATTSTPTFAGVLTNSIDRASAGTLTLGATNATAISLNQDTTLANSSDLTVSGGNISQTGSGTLSTGTGAVSLNGATTVASGQQFSALGKALFQASTAATDAFLINNSSGATILGVNTQGVTNIVTNSSFATDATGWAAIGEPTPVPTTFAFDPDNSADTTGGSLHIINDSGTSKQGAAYAISGPALSTATKYTLSFKVRSNTSSSLTIKSGYYSGSDLSGANPSESCSTPNVTLYNWTEVHCTFTTGGTAVSGIYVRATKSLADWQLDRVIVQTGNYTPLNNGFINAAASVGVYTDSDTAFSVQGSSNVYPIMGIDTNAGVTVFRPRYNDTNALEVRNADNSLVFNVLAGVAGNLASWNKAVDTIYPTAPKGRHNFQPTTATTSTGDTYGYVVGGVSQGGTTNAVNSVSYARLSGTGGEDWVIGNSTGLAERASAGVVSAKGYIYVIGGQDDTLNAQSDVYFNKVASDGSLEYASWKTGVDVGAGANLNTARTRIEAVYSNGYIYVFGGSTPTASSSAINSVEKAQVHADGTLGAWTTDTSLSFGLNDYGAVVSNGYIYLIGGIDNGSTGSAVYYSQIGVGGSLGAWQTSATLPAARSGGAAAVANGYVYYMGGDGTSTVYFGALDSGGGVQGWSESNVIDQNGSVVKRSNPGAFAFNNTIYYLGGSTSGPATSHAEIYYASASGNSSVVGIDGNLSVTRDVTVGGSLQVITRVDSTAAFTVSNATGGQVLNVDTLNSAITLNGVNSGELHNWLTTTPLAAARANHGAVAVNGYAYVVSGSSSPKVSYATIKTDGSLGAWTDNAVDLPDYKNFSAVAASNGYIYVVGGYDAASGASPTNKIYYGRPNTDGSVSAWQTSTNNLNTAVGAAAISIVNGYMYISGGATSSSAGVPTTPTDVVQYAKLNADGSLGSFSTTTVLPATRMGGRSAVANGYLYFTGGAASGGSAQANVYYAALSTSGTVGSWTGTSTSPNAKAYHSAFILNGYIYMMGGTTSTYGSGSSDVIDFGKLESDGEVTQWFTTTEPLLDTVQGHATIVANGYVYVLGGYGPVATVMYATASRVSVGGSLDLVGLGSRTLSDAGGGGELTAGNTTVVGTLDVRNAANFSQSLSVDGIFTAHDDVLLQSENDSANAFQVQNSSGTVLLGVDAAAGQVNVNADMLFGDANSISINTIQHTANGQDLNIDAGSDVITFTAGGKTFIFPTTGPGAQTICTTGISCASGGGQAVLLASGSAQTNNTTDASIFINNTSTGNLLQLQSSATDVFVVDSNGLLTLGTPGSAAGSIVFSDGTSSFTVTIATATLTGNRAFSFPDSASGEICVASGNCAGAGSGVTASTPGTANTIAKFTAGQNIGNSNITDDGTTVAIQGSNGLVLGVGSSISGQLKFMYSANGFSSILQPGGFTGDHTITLPDADGEICTSSGNCFGSGSGATLQAAYNAGNSISTTDNRNINFTLADTSTDSSFVINLQGTGNAIKFQDGGTDIFSAADGGVFTLKSTSDSASAFVLQNNSNVALLTADASAMKLKIGTGTPTLGSGTSGALYVTDSAEFAGQIRIGDGTNNAAFDGTNHQLTFSGNARHTRRISLAAEYVGAVLDGDGGSNTGTMTAGYDSSQKMNYYKWTTSQASSQDYDIVIQMQIPSDFSAWAASNPLSYSVYSSTTSANTIQQTITDTANSAQTTTDITPSSTNTWQTKNPATLSSGTYTAGSTIIIRLHLTSPTSGDIRVGRIYLDYLSAF